MINNPIISVIMPSLNVQQYIEKAVSSVMQQTLKNIEIICIDAGSTDGTLEVINMLMEEDSRIRLINSPVKSYGYQINYAIKEARGKYIAIVETDDYINADMYEDLYSIAIKNAFPDIVKGNYQAFWTQKNGERVFLKRENLLDTSLYGEVITPLEKPQIATTDWYLWTGIYKKSMIINKAIKLSETKGAAFQDIGFLHRSSVAAKSTVYVNKAYYNYCLDREDSSSNANKGLEYSYYEYERLLEEEWNYNEQVILYARMATFFSGCIKDIKKQDLDNSEKKKQFNWFRDKLKVAIEEGIINEKRTNSFVWSRIFPLPDSMEAVYENEAKKTEEIKDKLGPSESVTVIIFGCGNFGYNAKKWLLKNQYRIIGYSDNNEKLWGSSLDGLPILKPDTLEINNNNYKILIANERHSEEIKRQLMDYGVKECNIAVFE